MVTAPSRSAAHTATDPHRLLMHLSHRWTWPLEQYNAVTLTVEHPSARRALGREGVVQCQSVPNDVATRPSQLALEVGQRVHPTFVREAKRRCPQLEVNEPLADQLREQRCQVDWRLSVKRPCQSDTAWGPFYIDRDLKCDIAPPRQSLLHCRPQSGGLLSHIASHPDDLHRVVFLGGLATSNVILGPACLDPLGWHRVRDLHTRMVLPGLDASSRRPEAFSSKQEVERPNSQ
jgi:hypothetical protein